MDNSSAISNGCVAISNMSAIIEEAAGAIKAVTASQSKAKSLGSLWPWTSEGNNGGVDSIFRAVKTIDRATEAVNRAAHRHHIHRGIKSLRLKGSSHKCHVGRIYCAVLEFTLAAVNLEAAALRFKKASTNFVCGSLQFTSAFLRVRVIFLQTSLPNIKNSDAAIGLAADIIQERVSPILTGMNKRPFTYTASTL
jgi:hypothetical protein